jgi:di/tricarboxylate transporter
MKLSTYAIIVAILALIYGIGMLFFPVQFAQNYGVTLDPVSTGIAREFGAAMLAFAIVYWINRNVPESERSWSGLLWSGVVYNVAIFVIALMAKRDDLVNSMNWSTIILSAILTLCSLYFLFKKRVAA